MPPNLDYDKERQAAIHERWRREKNRDMDSESYEDGWYAQQCFSCSHYLPLAGPLGEDYGACANPQSLCDRRVMFEHDGCGEHDVAHRYR